MLQNLLDFDQQALSVFCAEIGEKPFRARQLLRWIHKNGEADFAAMTDISKALRQKLTQQACVQTPQVVQDHISADGTRKWLLDVGTGNAIEMVYIPESTRGTLCVSSQAGCALDCSFCSTGKQGFNRNLSVAEIIGQLWWANHQLGKDEMDRWKVTNVVMMGMGEPLLNYENTIRALKLMLDDHAYGLSRRRVTLSTSGVVPAMDRLKEDCPVALAISLHAPNDALRDQLVPINQKYPLQQLMAACQRYLPSAPRDFLTFEYVMLAGVNDQPEHIKQLVQLVESVPCKFNLIPFNPFPGTDYQTSGRDALLRFRDGLNEAGIVTTIRRTRGDDIAAACGQLAGQVKDKTRRTIRLMENSTEQA